jgi:hypothetical protein
MKEKKRGKDGAKNRAEDGRSGAEGSSQTDSPKEMSSKSICEDDSSTQEVRRLSESTTRLQDYIKELLPLAVTALGMQLLVRGGAQAKDLLRRVTSRRRNRCELSLIAAVIALVQQDKTLFAALSAQTKFKLDYVL